MIPSVYELQEPSSALYNPTNVPALHARLDTLQEKVSTELQRQGFEVDQIQIERLLHMRFNGSDTSLMMYVFSFAFLLSFPPFVGNWFLTNATHFK